MSYKHRENRIQTTSGGFQGDNVGDHMTRSFGQWHEGSIYKHQLRSRRVQTAIPVHLLHRMYLPGGRRGVTWPLSRWAAWTSADPTRSPAESCPWPDTSRQPGCACTERQEQKHRWDFERTIWNFLKLKAQSFCKNSTKLWHSMHFYLNVEMVQYFLMYYVL